MPTARRVPAAATPPRLPSWGRLGPVLPALGVRSVLCSPSCSALGIRGASRMGGDSLPLVESRGGNSLPGVTATGGGDSPTGTARWAGIPPSTAHRRQCVPRVNPESRCAGFIHLSISGGKDPRRWQLRISKWRGSGRHLGGGEQLGNLKLPVQSTSHSMEKNVNCFVKEWGGGQGR